MMGDVKRYKKHGEILGRVLVAAQDGDYVKYADMAALQDRVDKLETKLAKAHLALNYFLLRDPDKPSSWEYTRDRAEQLARTTLGTEGGPGMKETTPQDLLVLLKGKYSSLTIGFNDNHACNYVDAKGWRDQYGFYGGGKYTHDVVRWPSDEERDKAIEANSVWTIQWYPDTPNGFYCVGASTFEDAARYALTMTP